MSEFTIQREFHDRHAGGSLQRADTGHENETDPKNESDVQMVREWLQFADFATVPELMRFNSVKQLAKLLAESTREFLVSRHNQPEYERALQRDAVAAANLLEKSVSQISLATAQTGRTDSGGGHCAAPYLSHDKPTAHFIC